jgi:hypothetical protein
MIKAFVSFSSARNFMAGKQCWAATARIAKSTDGNSLTDENEGIP